MKSVLFKLLLASFLFAFATPILAQNKYVQRTFAYYDSSKTTGSKTYFIYIQMPKDSIPIWDTAMINGS